MNDFPAAVRILPMNLRDEFPDYDDVEELQQRFFQVELPAREKGRYFYRERGLHYCRRAFASHYGPEFRLDGRHGRANANARAHTVFGSRILATLFVVAGAISRCSSMKRLLPRRLDHLHFQGNSGSFLSLFWR